MWPSYRRISVVMVKFSHGCWHPAADTLIDWAVETVKAQANEDSLHFVTVCAWIPRCKLLSKQHNLGIQTDQLQG